MFSVSIEGLLFCCACWLTVRDYLYGVPSISTVLNSIFSYRSAATKLLG